MLQYQSLGFAQPFAISLWRNVSMPFSDAIFQILDIIGTIAFAVSGATVAIQKKTDLFGVLFLGVITACGGGMTRDLILGRIPPMAFLHPLDIAIAAGSAFIVFLLAKLFRTQYLNNSEKINPYFNIFDAAGLGIFTVTGSQAAIDLGFSDNPFLVIAMGTITAVGGGLLRDVIIHEVPYVLKKHIYAVASIIGGVVFWLMSTNGVSSVWSAAVGVIITFVVRILATIFKWNLPKAIN
jgi:uncharacterized membrane protein YeiH